MMDTNRLLQMTTDIVSAHATSYALKSDELLGEIQNVYAKLSALGGGADVPCVSLGTAPAETTTAPTPTMPLEAAFGTDRVFCLVCGKGMRTLKRHLGAAHGMTPREYRKKYGIPAGKPLTAKTYSEKRSKMARDLNMGERLVEARKQRDKRRKSPSRRVA